MMMRIYEAQNVFGFCSFQNQKILLVFNLIWKDMDIYFIIFYDFDLLTTDSSTSKEDK